MNPLYSRNYPLALATAREYAALRDLDSGDPRLSEMRNDLDFYVGQWTPKPVGTWADGSPRFGLRYPAEIAIAMGRPELAIGGAS